MEKKAALEEIYNEAFKEELEKIASCGTDHKVNNSSRKLKKKKFGRMYR